MKEIFYDFYGYNKSLFITLNHITNYDLLPFILKYISSIFNIENFAIAYVLLCLYYYLRLKKLDNSLLTQEFHVIYNRLVYAGICYTFLGVTYACLKFSINLPRPFCSISDKLFYTIMDTSKERCLSSFPSAHTGLSIMITYLLWPYLTLFMKLASTAIVCLVAISRITLAMHYPSDILYSICAVLFVILISKITYNLLKNNIIKYFEHEIKKLLFR